MKTLNILAVLAVTLTSALALADARSIETADCKVTATVDGSSSNHDVAISLEKFRGARNILTIGNLTLQVEQMNSKAILGDRMNETVNPVRLVMLVDNGPDKIRTEGVSTYNFGEGTTTLKQSLQIQGGSQATIDASCSVGYVE